MGNFAKQEGRAAGLGGRNRTTQEAKASASVGIQAEERMKRAKLRKQPYLGTACNGLKKIRIARQHYFYQNGEQVQLDQVIVKDGRARRDTIT